MNKKLSLVVLFVCFQISSLFAQRSLQFTASNHVLREAIKDVDMHYYQQAYLKLNTYLHNFREENLEKNAFEYQQATYLYKVSALALGKPGAQQSLMHFVDETSFLNLKQAGCFELGKYAFEHSQFDQAIRYYEAVGIEMLTNQELIQRNFELGYSYLVTQQLDKVEPFFQSAKNIPGEYFKPGNYYHGLLAYYKKNYKEAKESFTAVKDDERYKKIIPFYLTEIDYMTGEKEKALRAALSYLASTDKLYYDVELNQMVAQIYCEKEDFANAELYYSNYINRAVTVHDEDYFKLGYCQFAQHKIEPAIEHLEKVSKNNTDLSQHAIYLLAICYLKNNQHEKAAATLETFLSLTNDAEQKELINFTLAKLSYEHDDAQTALSKLNTFKNTYPLSANNDEVNELLIHLYMQNQHYEEALQIMNGMKKLSFNLQKIYQKASYARGIDLLKDSNPQSAMNNFQEAKKYPADRSLVSLSDFWLSECNYRLGKFDDAFTNTDFFLNLADTSSLAEYTKKMHITRAYIYLQKKDTTKLIEEYSIATGDTSKLNWLTQMDSIRVNYIPEKNPVIEIAAPVFVYDLPEEKISFAYKPIALKPLALQTEMRRKDQTNFIEAGVGNLSSLRLAAGFNFDKMTKMPLYVDMNRGSSKGNIVNQDMNSTHAGAYSNKELSGHTIDAALEFDRSRVYYYGSSSSFIHTKSELKQTFQNIGITANVEPLHENLEGIKYKADCYMGLYTDKNSNGEFSIKVNAPVSKQVKDDLLIQSDVVIDANIYFAKGYQAQGNSLISIRPSVTKTIEKLRIKAGLYPSFGQKIDLLPDVSLQYPVSAKYANIELAWQKNVRLNTFRQLTSENPFLVPYYSVHQSANTEIFALVKGSANSNLSYALRSGMAIINNLPLYANNIGIESNQFYVMFESKATAFLFEVAADYTVNSDLQVGGNISLRPIVHLNSHQEAWQYIPSEANVYGKARLIKNLSLNANLIVMAGSKFLLHDGNGIAYSKTAGTGVDLNIGGCYTFLKNWNAMLDIHNLLGSKYQRWYGYPMYGMNAMAGVRYSFQQVKFTK